MYSSSSEWVQKFSISRQAERNANGRIITPIPAIEPDVTFTKNTIGFICESDTAPQNWYTAGELYQAQLVGFGNAGYAQTDTVKTILRRYQIHRFNMLPSLPNENRYLISFIPKPWIPDIRFTVWEYIGTNQGTTNEEIEILQRQQLSRLITESQRIRTQLNRIENLL